MKERFGPAIVLYYMTLLRLLLSLLVKHDLKTAEESESLGKPCGLSIGKSWLFYKKRLVVEC